MATILIGWELGANRGHVVKLGAIAERLRARGFDVVFAVQRPDALRAVRAVAERSPIHQAPVWPGLLTTAGFRALSGPLTYGDVLADLGLRDSGVVEYLIRVWDSLIALVKPTVVVGEFAPALQMAARGRLPLVTTGTGFSVPPATLDRFPLLDDRYETPCYDEAALLRIVNRAASRTGRAAYDRLPQIAAADAAMPAVFRELDPYADVRVEMHIAPFLGATPAPPETPGDEIFVYLSEMTRPDAPALDAVAALAGRGLRVRAHLPQIDADTQARLAGAGVMLSPEPVPIAEIVRRSRIAVTNGGIGLASAALAAGLPLAVLPTDLEKTLNGRALERLGVGRCILLRQNDRPSTGAELADAIEAATRDNEISKRAAGLAPGFQDRLGTDPADAVAAAVAMW